MEACELVLRLPTEMCREGRQSAMIPCFQFGKRIQVTLRRGVIKLFGQKRLKSTYGLHSTSKQQITNRPAVEILDGLCERCTDTDASAKLFVDTFESRRNINCVAMGGVIKESGTAKIPHNGRPGVRANPGDTYHDVIFAAPLAKRLSTDVQRK